MEEISTTSPLDHVSFLKQFLKKVPKRCLTTEDQDKVLWSCLTDKMSSDSFLTKPKMNSESS
jgi:hypothetical protein